MYNDYYVAMGMFFKEKRHSKGLTFEQVGNAIGKSKAWYYDAERGRNKIFLKDAKLLCDFYGCTLNDVQGFIDNYQQK